MAGGRKCKSRGQKSRETGKAVAVAVAVAGNAKVVNRGRKVGGKRAEEKDERRGLCLSRY